MRNTDKTAPFNHASGTHNGRHAVRWLMLSALAGPLFAGALTVQIGNPTANREAMAKGGVVIVRTTACHAPEKSAIAATAEGIVDGKRQSMPLKLIPLSEKGTFVVTREWPKEGVWVIRFTATNPEYKNYATGALVSIRDNAPDWDRVKLVYHAPNAADVNAALSGE